VDEARRVEQHERVVERQVALERRIGLDLGVREHGAQHAQAVERGVPEEHPRGAEVGTPPHQQERHERCGHRHGDRRSREPEALPGREPCRRQRDPSPHAVALELEIQRPARPALGAEARAHERVVERDAVQREQTVARRERAARGRPEHALHHAAGSDARAESRVGPVREEARQRHAEAGEECGHCQRTPDAHIEGHAETIPYGMPSAAVRGSQCGRKGNERWLGGPTATAASHVPSAFPGPVVAARSLGQRTARCEHSSRRHPIARAPRSVRDESRERRQGDRDIGHSGSAAVDVDS
jgi:hypothetical protein